MPYGKPGPYPETATLEDIERDQRQYSHGTGAPTIALGNYEWGGRPTGAADDVRMLGYQAERAGQRQGVQLDPRQADAALAQALLAGRDQGRIANEHFLAAQGVGPSAAAIGSRTALDQALQSQAAVQANQGYGVGAAQGASGMVGLAGQYGQARAAEVANAQAMFNRSAADMRARELQQMGMSYEQAMRQAQLEDSQRGRNDAMSRYFQGQQHDIQSAQLQGNMGYEAQSGANALSVQRRTDEAAAREYEKRRQYAAAGMQAGGTAASLATR